MNGCLVIYILSHAFLIYFFQGLDDQMGTAINNSDAHVLNILRLFLTAFTYSCYMFIIIISNTKHAFAIIPPAPKGPHPIQPIQLHADKDGVQVLPAPEPEGGGGGRVG